MRHVIRSCYLSLFSRKVRHNDRQAERMIARGYSFADISEKSGKDIEWLKIVKEIVLYSFPKEKQQ